MPEPTLDIQNGEKFGAMKPSRDVFNGGQRVMLALNGLVEVLGIKTNVQCSIFLGYYYHHGADPVCGFRYRCNYVLLGHVDLSAQLELVSGDVALVLSSDPVVYGTHPPAYQLLH